MEYRAEGAQRFPTSYTLDALRRAMAAGDILESRALSFDSEKRLHFRLDTEGRIVLTMKELLGTWLENAAAFAAGETVVGRVRSVEPYGVFVELAPNLAGLAEAAPGLDCGQLVSVYIKSIIPEKMKINLVVLHAMRDETFAFPLEYRLHAGHIGRWIYSVPGAARVIETIFDG